MTLPELKAQCLKAKEQGSSQIILVIPRKSPPSSDYLRVKGMGKGYLCNAQQNDDGKWRCVAYFNVDVILKTIAKQEAIDEEADKKAFRDIVALALTMFDKRDLADMFQVAPSTLDRWVHGVANPHPRVRKMVVDKLKEAMDAKIQNRTTA